MWTRKYLRIVDRVVFRIRKLLRQVVVILPESKSPKLSLFRNFYQSAIPNNSEKSGIAFYDLDSNPLTYNVIEYLELAQQELQLRGCKKATFVIMPRSGSVIRTIKRTDYDCLMRENISNDEDTWRLWNLIIPAIAFYPFFNEFTVSGSRHKSVVYSKSRECFPAHYNPIAICYLDIETLYKKHLTSASKLIGIRVPDSSIVKIGKFIVKKNINPSSLITVTLRIHPFDQARNSNLTAWEQFAIWLKKNNKHLIVLPDQDTYYSGALEKFSVLNSLIEPEFAWNIYLRAALYESARVNFLVNNGPSALAVFNKKANYVIMNFLSPGSVVTTSKALKALGHLSFNDRLPWGSGNQRVCHEQETLESLIAEYKKFFTSDRCSTGAQT